ncbi:hypothetical protein [Kutzneria albida]|uniref:Uncharacterized protein n=1 Tax=Kutzneria albida DSM 43870 TaxID=1449976 RepID=W5WJF0_9PSEU|nr:hypothetical protein [Kutzneria albida]AHH98289.1 hypothetical protein KALB_4927 [Kutzneria albida DSM 43870]
MNPMITVAALVALAVMVFTKKTSTPLVLCSAAVGAVLAVAWVGAR